MRKIRYWGTVVYGVACLLYSRKYGANNPYVLILLFMVLYGLILWEHIYYTQLYLNIYKRGIKLTATLASCKKQVARWDMQLFFPKVIPIVSLVQSGKRLELKILGNFDRPPCNLGEEIDILFWDNEPEYAALDFPLKKNEYIWRIWQWNFVSLVFCGLWVAFQFVPKFKSVYP